MDVNVILNDFERLKKAWDHDLYRVRLRMTGSIFTMEIK